MSAHIQTVFGAANFPSLNANDGIKVGVVYPGQPEADPRKA